MEQLIPILLGLGVFAVLAIAYASFRSGQRRQTAFTVFAAAHGLDYHVDDPFGIDGWGFALFQRGDGRGVENVLHGEWEGTPARAFDYWYYERTSDGDGGSSKTYHRFTCAVTPIEAACAHLVVEEEHVFSRLADLIAFQDIRFESEAFNRTFQVRCDDPPFAHAFIDARMIAWMLAQGEGQVYEILGDKLLLVRRTIEPEALGDLLGSVRSFAATVPRVVFSLYPRSG
ncbi:MAG TPA: hypothetical protein VE032_10695 [Actinomycetota bacterium]|nr:hypothetical protein [Actinomycetota bacterium]